MRAVRTAVIAGWLITFAWLIRYEAFPELFTRSLMGYQSLLPKNILARDSWMKIRLNNLDIGFAFSGVNFEDLPEGRRYVVNQRTMIKMGKNDISSFDLDSSVKLDPAFRIRTFESFLTAPGIRSEISGTRKPDGKFHTILKSSRNSRNLVLDIPDNAVLFNPFSPLLPSLRPGANVKMKILDPLTLKTSTLMATCLRTEPLTYQGAQHDCSVVQTKYRDMEFTSWIDHDGVVFRQSTPFGLLIERCDPETAYGRLEPSSQQGLEQRHTLEALKKYIELLKEPVSKIIDTNE